MIAMVIYKSISHLNPLEERYDSLEEAIAHAASDLETDAALPLEVTDEKGVTILNRDQLYERADALTIPRALRAL